MDIPPAGLERKDAARVVADRRAAAQQRAEIGVHQHDAIHFKVSFIEKGEVGSGEFADGNQRVKVRLVEVTVETADVHMTRI